MKLTKRQLTAQTKRALKTCFERIPSIAIKSIEAVADPKGKVLLVKLNGSSGVGKIIAEVRNSGQPRIVREAIGSLLKLTRNDQSTYGIVVAPYISPASAKICEEENVGFVDFTGNYRLRFANVFIERSGQQKPAIARREHKSLFSQKASRILRILFENPKKKWRVAGLAKEAQVSLGQAFNVKELLLDQEFITVDEEGISLTDPEALLAMWAAAYAPRKKWVNYYSLKSPAEIEAALVALCAKKKITYALMGFSAAARYAPFVRSNRAMAYVSADAGEIARNLDLKEVPSGTNVTLAFNPDEGVYYGTQEIDGMKIVSPIQAYLDLIGTRGRGQRFGRGEEAAEMILKRKVRPTW